MGIRVAAVGAVPAPAPHEANRERDGAAEARLGPVPTVSAAGSAAVSVAGSLSGPGQKLPCGGLSAGPPGRAHPAFPKAPVRKGLEVASFSTVVFGPWPG